MSKVKVYISGTFTLLRVISFLLIQVTYIICLHQFPDKHAKDLISNADSPYKSLQCWRAIVSDTCEGSNMDCHYRRVALIWLAWRGHELGKISTLKTCCYGSERFIDNAIDPSRIIIPILRFVKMCPTAIQTDGKIAYFYRIFIKSAIDQTSLKVGMIAWVNSIIHKNIRSHSNMPWRYRFS